MSEIRNGVPQGSFIAPYLFNIAMEPLMKKLREIGIEHRFYADDIALIGNKEQVMKSLRGMQEWNTNNNMLINKKKSGLMRMNGDEQKRTEIDGYPVVEQYLYLGMKVARRLTVKDHTDNISRKIQYYMAKLAPIRHRSNLKMNKNLFSVYIEPIQRLGISLYIQGSAKERQQFEKSMRIKFKLFCRLPITTANKILRVIGGDFGGKLWKAGEKVRDRMEVKQGKRPGRKKEEIQDKNSQIKQFPPKMIELLRLLYGTKCAECNMINNTTHIRTHGYKCNPSIMIQKYQRRHNRKVVNSMLNSAIKVIENRVKAQGKKRGRR